ncbi:2OG-FeII_Oxy domain-containing protein/DIOX_N domain-containing protein [Cephalotus follicularis]|uniref:2-oxoglutarate-dependent dioxygenase DAO n=1 Tax=Cephalotus follicularis TaxID=3775 RepID=A0A1Q3C3M9_CEPFO|nr:2OG-FeII_Oxy domain-containing protein/DIOX_N domain-containing protein [Cephalotus follicularis]
MGFAETLVPLLDLSGEGPGVEQGGERWKVLCNKVREACENYGCFMLSCDKIPKTLRDDMFVAMKDLFDLPEQTKRKHQDPKPYRSYLGKCPIVPLHESFGIDDATRLDVAQEFTNLMWPEGNPNFCDTLNIMSSKLQELNYIVIKMIFESFGMEKHYDSHMKDTNSIFRVMKYNVPAPIHDSTVGLVAHTDKNTLAILCQNEVQGLEILTKQGEWVLLTPPQDAFIVIVGDAMKAWSNGRLVAAKHRVMISGDKDRYSCGLFSVPKEGAVIEVPMELVDKEHPLLYKPFKFSDYFSYYVSNISDDALETYAAV